MADQPGVLQLVPGFEHAAASAWQPLLHPGGVGGNVDMGLGFLGDVLKDWRKYEMDDSIYVPAETEPSLDAPVNVLPFDRTRKRDFEGQRYLLGIENVRDIVEGLERQLGRVATQSERLRAVLHYARHDAFIEPGDAVGG